MFTKLVITHKSGNKKSINIENYTIRDLNNIAVFYDNHKDYEVGRI